MAISQGIRAGRAYVELGVSDQLTKGLAKAQRQLMAFGEALKSIGKRLMAIGMGATAFMAGAVKSFSDGTHELLEMSKRTGVSVETLSELGYAAAQSGVDMESLEKGLRLMQRTVVDAARGSKSAQEALALLGLTIQDLDGLAPEKQFKLIADRLSQIKDPTIRAAMALELFGRSGTQLLPMLGDGAKGIETLQQEARALGLTVSTSAAESAAKLHDSKALWLVAKKLYNTIGAALAPAVTTLANAATQAVVSVTRWVKEHKSLIVTAAQAAVAIAGVGVALYATGTVITKALGVLTVLKTAVMGVGMFLSAMGSILAGLVSPIGVVIAAVVVLGGALLVTTGAGAEALAWLGDQFQQLRATVSKVMTGIADALTGGDIGLAARILWLSLKLAWQEGVAALNGVWLEAKRFFIGVAQKMWYGALATAEEVFHALEVAWIETTAFFSSTWTNFTSGFQKAWNTAVNWTTKRLLELQGLFDDSFDVEAAKQMADEDLAATNAEIEQQRQAALKSREQRRQDERDQAAKLNEATLAEIGKQFDEAQKALDADTDAKLAGTRQALAEARKQLDDALAAAKTEREAADQAGGPPAHKAADPLAGLEDRLSGLGDLMASKISVVGTFNAVAAGGLATGNDAAERTARASEQTARNTQRLVEAAANGGLRFT